MLDLQTSVARSFTSRAEGTTGSILLLLPPFWPPLIPPMGLATLKSHLLSQGFRRVRAVDLNCVDRLRGYYRRYLACLRERIPRERLGVLGKLGHELLQNHLLAWKNCGGDSALVSQTVGEIITHTFYIPPDPELIGQLHVIVQHFFDDLRVHLLQLYGEYAPNVLGVSVPDLSTVSTAITACEVFKEIRPGGLTVLGGSIFLTGLADSPDFPRFLQRASAVDKVVVGDGATHFVDILRDPDRSERVHVAKPPGFTAGAGSRTPNPNYDDFDLNRYPYIGTEQTISCPFACGFCNLPRFLGPYRKRSGESIAAELMRLYQQCGSQLIYMADSLLNPVIDDLTSSLAQLQPSLYLDGYLRVQESLCDPERAVRLRRGGLYRARMGVESGSQRILDLMDKHARVKHATGTVRALASAGIKTTVFIVVGYPGETEEDFQATLEWITELQDDIWQLDCSPFAYWYSGQCQDEVWAAQRQPLYSPKTQTLLLVQTWTLSCEPSREEAYRRMNRVVEHCAALGIPDPYDIQEHYEADRRWKLLHANAVPSLIDFARGSLINEAQTVLSLAQADQHVGEQGMFNF